jgi:hypothetical protein
LIKLILTLFILKFTFYFLFLASFGRRGGGDHSTADTWSNCAARGGMEEARGCSGGTRQDCSRFGVGGEFGGSCKGGGVGGSTTAITTSLPTATTTTSTTINLFY